VQQKHGALGFVVRAVSFGGSVGPLIVTGGAFGRILDTPSKVSQSGGIVDETLNVVRHQPADQSIVGRSWGCCSGCRCVKKSDGVLAIPGNRALQPCLSNAMGVMYSPRIIRCGGKKHPQLCCSNRGSRQIRWVAQIELNENSLVLRISLRIN